ALVLLPDIDFDQDDFLKENGGKTIWTQKAKQFSVRMINTIIALDKALHSSAEVTPEPDWATNPIYVLSTEQQLRSEILESEQKLESAQKNKENLLDKLRNAGHLRALLYEKGKALESVIIEALRIMGFHATQYKQAESEFDVIFESEEGRLLGEVEGRDTKAINVDKLRQLSMNIHEDLLRDEVKSPAKGVLFGNGYRLSPPEERQIQFTEKCISSARSTSTALLTTSDLFLAAQYLSDQKDEAYAKQCREILLTATGPVTFPPAPTSISGTNDSVSE
ncbi:MAG: hypothetical protein WCC64_02120, partial [Aliidongia sp.]